MAQTAAVLYIKEAVTYKIRLSIQKGGFQSNFDFSQTDFSE